MKVKIDNIKIKNRIRENMGDLIGLEESIKTYGLLNPILISQNYELLAGARRLLVCRHMGWKEIEVNIINITGELDKLEIESHENLMRKDFAQDEINKIINKKVKLLKKGVFYSTIRFFKRMFSSISLFFSKVFKKTRSISSDKSNYS